MVELVSLEKEEETVTCLLSIIVDVGKRRPSASQGESPHMGTKSASALTSDSLAARTVRSKFLLLKPTIYSILL